MGLIGWCAEARLQPLLCQLGRGSDNGGQAAALFSTPAAWVLLAGGRVCREGEAACQCWHTPPPTCLVSVCCLLSRNGLQRPRLSLGLSEGHCASSRKSQGLSALNRVPALS